MRQIPLRHAVGLDVVGHHLGEDVREDVGLAWTLVRVREVRRGPAR